MAGGRTEEIQKNSDFSVSLTGFSEWSLYKYYTFYKILIGVLWGRFCLLQFIGDFSVFCYHELDGAFASEFIA